MPERLWAPWRMAYMDEPDPPKGCALCAYSTSEPSRESRVLRREAHTFVVLNKYPYTAGHVMVVPRRHVPHPSELTEEEHSELWRVVAESIAALEKATGSEGMNLGMNLGRSAGAGIDQHLHAHLVPRWFGDNNFMPVIADTRVMPQYLEDTWDRLAPSFGAAGGQR